MTVIETLRCGACGAAVPLADGAHTTCPFCETNVAISAEHQALRTRARSARLAREEAEAALRAQLEGAVPLWVPRIYDRVLMPLVILSVILSFAVTQHEYHWFAREWVVVVGMAPFLVLVIPAVVLHVRSQPWVYLQALGRELVAAPAGQGSAGASCGSCGAPLEIAPDALAATCDYCLTDSWLGGGGRVRRADEEQVRSESNLASLVAAQKFAAFDLRLLFAVSIPVITLSLAGMWFALPGRAVRLAMLAHRPGPWQSLGDLRDVTDMVLTDSGRVLVVHDGDVFERREARFARVARGYTCIAASHDNVLLAGPHGRVAWLTDDGLRPAAAVTDEDLVDAWVFDDGQAIAVGEAGVSVRYDAHDWTLEDTTAHVRLAGVWGRTAEDVYAVGQVGVLAHRDAQGWSTELVQDLPALTAVWGGTHGGPWIGGGAMDDATQEGVVRRLNPDGQSLVDANAAGVTALGGVGDELVIGRYDGSLETLNGDWVHYELTPLDGPIVAVALAAEELDFEAEGGALFTSGRLLVAGPNGVFVRESETP